jgi:hypothetical protein
MAAPALADTTIGQTGGANDCPVGPVTLADTNYVVPSGGWITTFSLESATVQPPRPPTETLDFLVLRPAQGNYTVVGDTDVDVLNTGGDEIFGTAFQGVFPLAIPVQGGEILGFYLPSGLPVCSRSVAPPTVGGLISGGSPTFGTDGAPVTVSLPGGDPTMDLNLSANLITVPTRNECKGFGWFRFGFKGRGQCLKFSRTH